MNDQEKIELGEYCERLLKQDSFTKLTEIFEKQMFQDFVNSGALEKNKREAVYASFTGVRDFLGLIHTLVDVKNELIEPKNPALSEETDALPQDND